MFKRNLAYNQKMYKCKRARYRRFIKCFLTYLLVSMGVLAVLILTATPL